MIEEKVKQYLETMYGAPTDPNRQYMFYRCEVCRALVTWNHILQGGCGHCVGTKLRVAHLTTWEKFRLLFMPWTI